MNENHRLITFCSISFLAAAVIFFCAGWFGNDGPNYTEPEPCFNYTEPCLPDGTTEKPGVTTQEPGVTTQEPDGTTEEPGVTPDPGLSEQDQARLDLISRQLEDKLTLWPVEDDFAQVDADQLREFLQELTLKPHLAGTPRDQDLVNYIRDTWNSQGLDTVDVLNYDITLSVPSSSEANRIELMDGAGSTFYTTSNREDIADLDDDFIDAYLAFTPAGEVVGDIVYTNYGTVEDFAEIKGLVDTKGKICMSRYGKIFRGNKVQNSYEAGCIAAILFSDPEDVAGIGIEPENVYPNTIFLPGDGIQRGTTILIDGDAATPNWPSIANAFRIPYDEMPLMKIPAQPIGYNDATEILKLLKGPPLPSDEWIGGIDSIEYNLGGDFIDSCPDCIALVKTYNSLDTFRGSDVVGVIKGEFEPDQYVMLGNHRDAWGYGAVDPSSGTAQMLEVTRVLGEKVKSGWRPRRSIVFFSWAAEEFGLIGSREFVEDRLAKLMHRSVAYINVDRCDSGPILGADASPTIAHLVLESTKAIPNPWDESESYYDFWNNYLIDSEPEVGLPTSASDNANFIFFAGIPVIHYGLEPDAQLYPTLANTKYPAYHTGYDTFDLVDNLIDPDFGILKTCARLSMSLIRQLSDPLVLNINPNAYFVVMDATMDAFAADGTIDKLEELGVDINHVLDQIAKFGEAAMSWQTDFDSNEDKAENPLVARQLNDQATRLDRLFLLSQGLPNRPEVRHAILSPSLFDQYGAATFPGITDLLHGYDDLDPSAQESTLRQLQMHVSDLMVVIKAAAEYLKESSMI